MTAFNIITNIIFGAGKIAELQNIIQQQKFEKALVITDQGIIQAGLMDNIQTFLPIKLVQYDQVLPNPTVRNCEEAFAHYTNEACDVIIAIGGGSPLDVAKAVALLATNGGRITDYEGIDKFSNDLLPIIAIPTTAGTASEVTNFTVITDEERIYKLTVGGQRLACKWAILDPNLTLTLPPHITAATGLDALVHAIESYTSKAANDITKPLAREAIRKISSYLRIAVFNGENKKAREEMLMGSLLAGLAFNNTRLGNCHAMSHPLSAFYGIPHGVANAILISYIMEFNRLAAPDLFVDIAQDMGMKIGEGSIHNQTRLAVEAVRELARDIGIPTTLQDYNINESDFNKMADDAMKSGNILVNPRVTNKEDILALYELSLRGESHGL